MQKLGSIDQILHNYDVIGTNFTIISQEKSCSFGSNTLSHNQTIYESFQQLVDCLDLNSKKLFQDSNFTHIGLGIKRNFSNFSLFAILFRKQICVISAKFDANSGCQISGKVLESGISLFCVALKDAKNSSCATYGGPKRITFNYDTYEFEIHIPRLILKNRAVGQKYLEFFMISKNSTEIQYLQGQDLNILPQINLILAHQMSFTNYFEANVLIEQKLQNSHAFSDDNQRENSARNRNGQEKSQVSLDNKQSQFRNYQQNLGLSIITELPSNEGQELQEKIVKFSQFNKENQPINDLQLRQNLSKTENPFTEGYANRNKQNHAQICEIRNLDSNQGLCPNRVSSMRNIQTLSNSNTQNRQPQFDNQIFRSHDLYSNPQITTNFNQTVEQGLNNSGYPLRLDDQFGTIGKPVDTNLNSLVIMNRNKDAVNFQYGRNYGEIQNMQFSNQFNLDPSLPDLRNPLENFNLKSNLSNQSTSVNPFDQKPLDFSKQSSIVQNLTHFNQALATNIIPITKEANPYDKNTDVTNQNYFQYVNKFNQGFHDEIKTNQAPKSLSFLASLPEDQKPLSNINHPIKNLSTASSTNLPLNNPFYSTDPNQSNLRLYSAHNIANNPLNLGQLSSKPLFQNDQFHVTPVTIQNPRNNHIQKPHFNNPELSLIQANQKEEIILPCLILPISRSLFDKINSPIPENSIYKMLYNTMEYADINLELKEVELKAHKAVLYSTSSFFRDQLDRLKSLPNNIRIDKLVLPS